MPTHEAEGTGMPNFLVLKLALDTPLYSCATLVYASLGGGFSPADTYCSPCELKKHNFPK